MLRLDLLSHGCNGRRRRALDALEWLVAKRALEQKSAPTFRGMWVGMGLGIPSCFKRAIFGKTSIRALLRPAVVFFHASATNGDLRPAAAFLGTFAAFLFSAVCVCVFGSCHLYSYYGVPNCTMNKCHLRLHLFSCVPFISLSLVSALGPVLAGPGLFIALSLLSLVWCAKQGFTLCCQS
jgi:hypothetical protein